MTKMTARRHIYILLLAAMLALGSVLTGSRAHARNVYNLGARWTFFTGFDTSTDNASVVYLPHTWNSDATMAGGTYFRGTGNYSKDVDIPRAWSGKRVFLRIGGAATVTDVFVNSRHSATHRGGNSAFTFEITDNLRYGQANNIRIVVSNSPRLDVLPTAGEENVYGGIFRSVEAIVCEPLSVSPAADGGDGVWITTTSLTPGKAEGNVRLSLLDMAAPPAGVTARVRFTDERGCIVAQNSVPVLGSAITLPFTIETPRLWQGTKDPYLYNAEVMLISGGGITTDSLTVRTGFRTFGIDGRNNFLVNGIPFRLRGVILHRDRMMVGTAMSPFQIEEDVNLIREMGANAVRVAGGQHSDYFYTLCDEAGLIVWNDAPFTGAAYPTDIDFADTSGFRDNGREQLREMISQLYNHPSVAIWGLFSDISMRTGDPVPYIKELDTLARKLDPGRLTAASSVKDGEVNFITDLISFLLPFGWESGMPDGVVMWLEQLRKGWPGLRAGVSFSAGASIYHQSERLEKTVVRSNHHPEGWQAFFHEQYLRHAADAPGLWGVFVGNMFDFGAARSNWGDGRGIDDRGLVTFDRKDRKDAFWAYKANWNTADPFVHIVGRRLDTRTDRRQTIRIYSNQPEVELFAAGRSLGKRTGTWGLFIWEDVHLRAGVNRLEAHAGGVSDRVSFTIDPDAAVNPTGGQPASAPLGRTDLRTSTNPL